MVCALVVPRVHVLGGGVDPPHEEKGHLSAHRNYLA